MKAGLNLLGLPALAQGGAGLVSGMEAVGLADAGVDLRVLAGENVAGELRKQGIETIAASGQTAGGPLGLVREAVSPYAYMSDIAPAGAFDGCDVVHCPLGFTPAPRHDGATVVTAVDLQHLYFPGFFSRRDRLIRAIRWHRSIRRADRVAVYSTVVKESVTERLGVDADRIDVVGACCNPVFYESRDLPEGPRDYLLYPASPQGNKNHGRLLEAFSGVLRDEPDLMLILVGPLMHDWKPVRDRIAELGLGDSVEIRGHVSLDELHGLYAGAIGLVFPSLFEGFGVPPLEAMAAGCPVVASSIPSVTEICGDAALYCDPRDTDSIGAGIDALIHLTDEDRDGLVASGRRRAEDLRPATMVAALMGSFERAIGNIAP